MFRHALLGDISVELDSGADGLKLKIHRDREQQNNMVTSFISVKGGRTFAQRPNHRPDTADITVPTRANGRDGILVGTLGAPLLMLFSRPTINLFIEGI